MAVLELTLVPIGTKEMGTVLEGDIDKLFLAVRKMQEAVFSKGANRVYSVIK